MQKTLKNSDLKQLCKKCSYQCAYDCTTVLHNTAQNSSGNLPPYPQTIIIAQMLSNGGEQQVLTTQPTSIEQIDYDCTNKSTESREPQWPMSFQRGTLDQTWRLGPSLRCSASSGGLSVGNSTSHKNSPAIHDVIMSSFRNNLPNGNTAKADYCIVLALTDQLTKAVLE